MPKIQSDFSKLYSLKATHVSAAINSALIPGQLDDGKPIYVGIDNGSGSGHIILITGHDLASYAVRVLDPATGTFQWNSIRTVYVDYDGGGTWHETLYNFRVA
jgi:outer membrane protein assembly factor BamB